MVIEVDKLPEGDIRYSVPGIPNRDVIKELLKKLEVERADRVQVVLLETTYTFRTPMERMTWILGFEAAWEIADELVNPYDDEGDE